MIRCKILGHIPPGYSGLKLEYKGKLSTGTEVSVRPTIKCCERCNLVYWDWE